ncbi:Transient receptor putative cation channel, subfamily C, member, partial [Halocaridina rubra]
DPRHTVESLIKGSGSWLSHASDRTGRLQTDLQLECATTISFIDLGNSGSVMISIDVGRSSWPSNQPLVTLLPTVALMTPAEWRAGKNALAVRMFKQVDFNSEAAKEKWDRVRIICTQPFRKDAQFGLSLLRLHTNAELSPLRDTLTKAVQDPVINMTQCKFQKRGTCF